MARTSSKAAAPKKISKELISRVRAAAKSAYAPYSNIRVGAALYCANGVIYTGCNVENASYSLTVCAERVALFKAVSEGAKDFALLLLHSPSVDDITPCGACLQVLSELAPGIVIATMNAKKEFRFHTLETLIRKPFGLRK